jgi:hypothetical protein
VPEHCAVAVADLNHQRRLHVLHAKDHGVSDVGGQIFPERHFHPPLSRLDVILNAPTGAGPSVTLGQVQFVRVERSFVKCGRKTGQPKQKERKGGLCEGFSVDGGGMAWVFKDIPTVGDMAFC